jgi:hypothetical protein
MKKQVISILILVLISIPMSAHAFNRPRGLAIKGKGTAEQVPEPKLKSPLSKKVDLAGKKELEFVWSPHVGRSHDMNYYDFRLYAGKKMVEKTLILKKKVSTDLHIFKVNSDVFEEGKTYTWSLRNVYTRGRKSKKNYHSFTITGK